VIETAEHEARRRAADAANGCAKKPRPPGDPRALIIEVLRRGPATRQEIRAQTGLPNAETRLAITVLMRTGSIESRGGTWRLR
jgi:hypothetical protein